MTYRSKTEKKKLLKAQYATYGPTPIEKGQPVKILVVEDDRTLRQLWEDVFCEAGYVVRSVQGAEEARKILMAEAQDLVLLDLCLGQDTGLSVATMATYSNPNCKVIVVTGSSLFPKGELFDISGSISAVLRKPVDVGELMAVSEHFIQTSQGLTPTGEEPKAISLRD